MNLHISRYKDPNNSNNQWDKIYIGLFGHIESSGRIENLGLENVTITGSGYVGGLVGLCEGGTISHCYVEGTGTVRSYNLIQGGRAGGLVGSATDGSLIEYSYTDIDVFAYRNNDSESGKSIGGLVGQSSANINYCYSNADISVGGIQGVGGLVGFSTGGYIKYSYFTGFINSGGAVFNSYNIGGIAGTNWGNIENCYSTGGIGGWVAVGEVAGIVGDNSNGNVKYCYSTVYINRVAGGQSLPNDNNSKQAICGKGNTVQVINSYSSKSYRYDYGGTQKSYNDLKIEATFEGWDFENVWGINPSKNNGLPIFETSAPEIAVATSLSFFDTDLNATKDTTITILNNGDEELVISAITVSAPFSVIDFTSVTLPAKVENQDAPSTEVTLRFSPTDVNSFNAFSKTLTITNTDENKSVTLTGTALAPKVSVLANLTFDNLAITEEGIKTLIITNSGNSPLSITDLSITDDTDNLFSIENTPTAQEPLTIAGNSTGNVNVKFSSDDVGTFTATVTVTSNSYDNATPTISLSATAEAPVIEITETSIAFDVTNAGLSSSKTLNIKNIGNVNLLLSAFTFSTEDIFSVTQDLPITVAPNATETITINFTPNAEGLLESTITIVDNDLNDDKVLDLSGTGVIPVWDGDSWDPARRNSSSRFYHYSNR